MNKQWTHYKLTPTRFRIPGCAIYIGRSPGVGWRFVVDCDGYDERGCIYASKAEILAALPGYASQWAKEWELDSTLGERVK